jgi:hypothetical protein
MPDVARKRDRWSNPDDIPEWFRELRGFDRLTITPNPVGEGHGFSAQWTDMPDAHEIPGGLWELGPVKLPNDLTLLDAAELDPLVPLGFMSLAASMIDNKTEELVAYCRDRGKSWTQIGAALGMSKQAAWERFSGED